TIASVLVGMVLALVVARRLAHPIKLLTHAMEHVDAGLTTSLNADRFDEIGQLQNSFLNMLSRLRISAKEQVQMQRLLIHSERLASIGTLASGVAHEINNPLAGVRSCLRRIQKEPENISQTKRYIDLMLTAVDRIGEIVKGMLDFARREGGEKKPLLVVEVLQEAVGLIDYQFRKKRVVLKTDFGKNLPAVMGDRGRIGQVFLNLMMNALDAMSQGNTLTVTCGTKDHQVMIAFKDTGCGIPENQINRIFDPFFTTKNVGDGTGLGLSIAHGIVEDHNGQITVTSEVGRGTEFVVFLPVAIHVETSRG
ncbi:MAG: sensor histidine kinase, partial [Candidatus Latescibacterota bacterium]